MALGYVGAVDAVGAVGDADAMDAAVPSPYSRLLWLHTCQDAHRLEPSFLYWARGVQELVSSNEGCSCLYMKDETVATSGAYEDACVQVHFVNCDMNQCPFSVC